MGKNTLADSNEEFGLLETETTISVGSRTVTLQSNPTTGTYLVVHDWQADEPLSTTLVTTVAAILEADISELPPLFDRVDSDALDQIFGPVESTGLDRESGCVTFPYSGCLLTVHGDGEIWIQTQPDTPAST
ncbi:HalOD1 output domain-containing protein [Halobacterium jilantaiense]|nr:HalOD1 output domain-containing protein [Halobacterium jilantaiense]